MDPELKLFVLADGMGGHSGGEIASAMATKTVHEVVQRSVLDGDGRIYPRELLTRAYHESNDRIFKKSLEEGANLRGMGTTMVTLYFHNRSVYVANVGDSRCYLFSAPHLWQITDDHSLINEQLRAGLITQGDVANFGAKNVITRSVGFEQDVQTDLFEREVHPGEIFLLCSDGLSSLVSNLRLADLFLTVPKAELAAQCVFEAKKAGGDDNVTVIVVSVEG